MDKKLVKLFSSSSKPLLPGCEQCDGGGRWKKVSHLPHHPQGGQHDDVGEELAVDYRRCVAQNTS